MKCESFTFCWSVRTLLCRTYIKNGANSGNFEFYLDSFWFLMVTMTTVGYGDRYPNTHIGRLIVFFGCLLGALLVSLMVVSLQNTTKLSVGEQRVYNDLIKSEVKQKTQYEASQYILCIIKIHMLNQKIRNGKKSEVQYLMMQKFGYLTRMKQDSIKLKSIFKKYASFSSSAEDILVKLNANGLEKLEEVYRNFGKAKKIERKCKRIISS